MFPLHDPLHETLREELVSYDDLTAALLARRGVVAKEEAEIFLNPSYDEHLHDPFLMQDMSLAAKRLGTAIQSGERIAVWSDYDCDGIPGGVVLHDFLKKVGANFENYIPHRHDEGYGMNAAGIEQLAKAGTKLIVTVDSGITDVEPIACANELGVEVIITDHHLPRLADPRYAEGSGEARASGEGGPQLPDAFAILNPNARESETYPFKSLCGSGVAWKLVCATLNVLRKSNPTSPRLRRTTELSLGWEKWLLDMVGLATIADMVPLVGENRVLATYGLKVLRKSPRLGLQKLCRGMRVEQRAITEDDVGFMIAPRVNAASRLGNARDAFELFTTTDENRADELAKKLEKMNRERKAQAGAITRAVHARLKERGEVRSVIALGDPEWRPALLGLVANTIADEYERPVFLWGREGNMSLKGSVRSGGNVHIMELMQATENVFVQCGGHAAAGGFTVLDTEVFFLEDRLVAAHAKLTPSETSASLTGLEKLADAVLAPEEVTEEFLRRIERLAPFGMGNPKPVFLFREVSLREISHFGKANEHLKLKIDVNESDATPVTNRISNGVSIDAVTFFVKGAVARTTEKLSPGSRINLLAHLERDTFSRSSPVRLRLLDIRTA